MLTINFDTLNANINSCEQALDPYKKASMSLSHEYYNGKNPRISMAINHKIEYLREAISRLARKCESNNEDMRKSLSGYQAAEEKVNTKFGIDKSSDGQAVSGLQGLTNAAVQSLNDVRLGVAASAQGLVADSETKSATKSKSNSRINAKVTSRSSGGSARVTRLSNVKYDDYNTNVTYDKVDAASKPNFNNTAAWKTKNIYYNAGYCGQCTWFAAGKFYEVYGYAPGFNGNGRDCAAQLVKAHPDKFALSDKPVAGAIFSCGYKTRSKNHTGMVIAVNGDKITIQHGNMNGKSDSFAVATTDWRQQTMSLAEFKRRYNNDVVFANPIKTA